MSIFELFGDLVRIFTDLVPRFSSKPRTNEVLVVDRFIFGPEIIRSRPVIYVPILDIVEYWTTAEVSVNAEQQSLETACGQSVTVDVGFSFKIIDHILVRQELSDDYLLRVTMIVRGLVKELVCGHTFNHLCEMGSDSPPMTELFNDINNQLDSYGMELCYLCFEDLSISANIRHFGISFVAPLEG